VKCSFLKKRTKKLLTYVEPGGAEGYRCTLMAFAFFLSADRLNMVFLLLFLQKRRPFFLLFEPS
jgi:hypothetical protein